MGKRQFAGAPIQFGTASVGIRRGQGSAVALLATFAAPSPHPFRMVPPNERGKLVGRRRIDHHLPNHDQTIIAKAMTSAILTKTKSILRSLSPLSLRPGGSGRFVGIIGSLLRLITRTAYRTSSRYARVHIQYRFMVAELADDPQRAHAL